MQMVTLGRAAPAAAAGIRSLPVHSSWSRHAAAAAAASTWVERVKEDSAPVLRVEVQAYAEQRAVKEPRALLEAFLRARAESFVAAPGFTSVPVSVQMEGLSGRSPAAVSARTTGLKRDRQKTAIQDW